MPDKVITDIYRSKCGEYYFTFAFYDVGNHFEIDILEMPSYGTRSTDWHITHRKSSNHGNDTRICFGDDSVVSTLAKAKKWAAAWAENTVNYLKFGNHFPNN